MKKKRVVDNFSIFKRQKVFSGTARIYIEAIFSDAYLDFLEKTTNELCRKNNQKDAEIYMNLIQEIDENIQHLKTEKIDVRLLTLVLTKSLVDLVMGSTNLNLTDTKPVLEGADEVEKNEKKKSRKHEN